MATHQKHPSIVALNTKKRVKQFKKLFNQNNNNNNNNNKNKKRKKRVSRTTPPVPPIPVLNPVIIDPIISIIPQPIHCHQLPSWLEINGDHHENEEILAISATLTLSTLIGKSTPTQTTNNNNNNVLSLKQSITSPIIQISKSLPFDDTNKNDINHGKQTEIKNELKPNKTKKIKPWKPMSNTTKKSHKTTASLLMLENRKLVTHNNKNNNNHNNKSTKRATESLILLQDKKLVNDGLKHFDHNDDDDDSYHIDDNPENRSFPIWLSENEEMEEIHCKHNANQLTDVLD